MIATGLLIFFFLLYLIFIFIQPLFFFQLSIVFTLYISQYARGRVLCQWKYVSSDRQEGRTYQVYNTPGKDYVSLNSCLFPFTALFLPHLYHILHVYTQSTNTTKIYLRMWITCTWKKKVRSLYNGETKINYYICNSRCIIWYIFYFSSQFFFLFFYLLLLMHFALSRHVKYMLIYEILTLWESKMPFYL